MRRITREQAKALKDSGKKFFQYCLYQSEKDAVLVEISNGKYRPFIIK